MVLLITIMNQYETLSHSMNGKDQLDRIKELIAAQESMSIKRMCKEIIFLAIRFIKENK